MKKLILGTAICALLAGCGQRTAKTTTDGNADRTTVQPAKTTDDDTKNDVVKLKVVDGKATATCTKTAGESVTFSFESGSHKKVHAVLTSSAPAANIRLSQIVMPDGATDGPWAREMNYELKSEGLYKLIVTENTMAGDPWAGTFTITLTLTE